MENELHKEIFPGNRLALITGASQRIGKAMCEHLAAGGWDIAIHCNRSEQHALELAQQFSDRFAEQKFVVFRADLLNPSETENLIPQVIEKMAKPDLLINNASVFNPALIKTTTSDFMDRLFQVNFKAPFLLMRDFANYCVKGVIINMADTRITGNKPDFFAYTLAKKALWELTKIAAVEFGPEIRVNAIAPGLTLPPEGKGEEYLCQLARNIPMKRPGGIAPILKTLDFILGNDYLTGQLLFCDGGQNLV
jgi:pteridine reductase